MYEPDIFQTTRRFGTILENVDLDPRTRALDLDSERFTENTRGAYPLEFIGNADETGVAGSPKAVVFLTADAFGCCRSPGSPEQAAYHFISGYRLLMARRSGQGAEGDVPRSARRSCWRPGGRRCQRRLERDDVPVWLVNTGWTGGPYGVGQRMNIAHTRSMVRAALDGGLDGVPTRIDPNFGVAVPTSCPDVPESFLDPRATWADPDAYDRAAARLSEMFRENFAGYAEGVDAAIAAAGPGSDAG
jgi:phosphoenolpyruvate carboxykinase (ATP)